MVDRGADLVDRRWQTWCIGVGRQRQTDSDRLDVQSAADLVDRALADLLDRGTDLVDKMGRIGGQGGNLGGKGGQTRGQVG